MTWRKIVAFLGYVLLVVVAIPSPLWIRTFLYQPFNIPSGSMVPTLLVGDYVFVSKFSYGYSNASLPFSLKLISGRILAAEPQRGDVVVFRLPSDESVDYVKRIVGLPGDHIQMINGELNINGAPVKRERIEDFTGTDDKGNVTKVRQWRLTLPNGVSYAALDLVDNGYYDNTPVYDVPPEHYFTLGDNRDNSLDSRARNQVGYVPFENLVGRVAIIFYSSDPNARSDDDRIRWDRLGTLVH
jgi:signal peptidase I